MSTRENMMNALYAYANEANEKSNRYFMLEMPSELGSFVEENLMCDMVGRVSEAGYEMEYSTQACGGCVDLYNEDGRHCGTGDYGEEVEMLRGLLLEGKSYEGIVEEIANWWIDFARDNEEYDEEE